MTQNRSQCRAHRANYRQSIHLSGSPPSTKSRISATC